MGKIYIKAWLDEIHFAISSEKVRQILSAPVTIPVPDAPEGICGLVFTDGEVLPLRTLNPERGSPARLVILCSGGQAYAATDIDTMGMLGEKERETADTFGDTDILLLGKEGTA